MESFLSCIREEEIYYPLQQGWYRTVALIHILPIDYIEVYRVTILAPDRVGLLVLLWGTASLQVERLKGEREQSL